MILKILGNTDQPIRKYVWKAALLSLIPSLIVATVVSYLLPESTLEIEGPIVLVVFGVLVFSPWMETLLMWPILLLFSRWFEKSTSIAAASAVLWGGMHSLIEPRWGPAVAWPFFVFSVCFLEWRKKTRWKAVLATALVHTLQNVLPAIALIVGEQNDQVL